MAQIIIKEIKIDNMFLVNIQVGDMSGYEIQPQFCTDDLELAQKWITRYNKIISDNTERIESIKYDDEKDDGFYFPYLYFLIKYDNPKAIIKEITKR